MSLGSLAGLPDAITTAGERAYMVAEKAKIEAHGAPGNPMRDQLAGRHAKVTALIAAYDAANPPTPSPTP